MSQADNPFCECGRRKSLEIGMGAAVYICWPCTEAEWQRKPKEPEGDKALEGK